MNNIRPFSLSALEKLAKIIGDRYTGTEITELFRKAGFPEIVHDGSTKWRFVYAELENLQKESSGPYNIAKIIEKLCDPQEYFGNANYHKEVLNKVNEILAFCGLIVSTDGTIISDPTISPVLKSSQTIAEKNFIDRNYHLEIRKHGQKLFADEKYFHAVFECCKAFEKAVKEKSKIKKHGTQLMSSALSPKGPLKLNAQNTETEINEQNGVMHLCMGLTSAIRNTGAHEPELNWPINQDDALDILSLLSFLWRKIDSTIYYNPDKY